MSLFIPVKNPEDTKRLSSRLANLYYNKIIPDKDIKGNPIFRLQEVSKGVLVRVAIVVVLSPSQLIPVETELESYKKGAQDV